MRSILAIFSAMIILGLLVGVSIPAAYAQETGDTVLTFHVHANGSGYSSQNLSVIPADSQDKILIAGNSTTTRTRAAIENLCGTVAPDPGTPTPAPSPTPTGTVTPPSPCEAVNLYFQVTWTLQWNSGLEEGCGMWGVCEDNVAPVITIEYGGSANPTTDSWGHCGSAGIASGSCTNDISGTIAAADIENQDIGTDDFLNEFFDVNYSDYWGGTSFQTSYSIILSTTPILEDCAGQFNIGGFLGSFNLAATNSAGVNLQTTLGMNYPAPGQWYAIQVSGAWKNNGTGPDLRTLAHKSLGFLWLPLVASGNVYCADTANDTYYLQMTSAAAVYLRVNDMDGNFLSNSGTLTIRVSSITSYNPYPDGCELQYQVGNLIEQGSVNANVENGKTLKSSPTFGTGGSGSSAQPTRYYMLETIGGPANVGFLTWGMDIGRRDNEADLVPSNWYEIKTAPFVTCTSIIDTVQHVRVFFPADSQPMPKLSIMHYYYALRVRDTDGNYPANSGSMGYRLYEATKMQVTVPGETPGLDGCSLYSHATTPLSSLVIQAVAPKGSSLPSLVSRSLYALEVTDGPWKEAGTTDSYSVELSDDNGETWVDLEDYPQLLCAASADGDHITIYIYGAAGKHWKARVNDQDSNFATNTLTIGMDIYAGLTSINEYPNCTQIYTLTKMALSDEIRTIPGNQEAGKQIPLSGIEKKSIISALEITDESKWYEAGAGDGSYLVDISDDGGATWTALEDFPSLCKEQIGDGDRFRIVFNTTSNNYALRVRDGDGNFLTNTGYVMYQLYKAVPSNPSPDTGDTTNPAPAEWVVACGEKYSRPGGFISWKSIGTIADVNISVPVPMVGEWIDYLRNAITFYFAWCPEHTDALKSVGAVALDKEPMASIQTMLNFIKSIQTMLAGYTAGGGADAEVLTSQEPDLFSDTSTIGQATGGGSGPEVPTYKGAGAWDMFMVGTFDPITNFWFGGKIDLTTALDPKDHSAMTDYKAACIDKFTPLWGTFSSPFCGFIAMMRESNIIKWLLLVIDLIVAVSWLFKYLPGWVSRFINAFKGGVSVLGKKSA